MCRAAYGGRMPAVLDENLQLKICRADMHGCLMKVTRALNSCLIGIQGNLLRNIDKKTVTVENSLLGVYCKGKTLLVVVNKFL